MIRAAPLGIFRDTAPDKAAPDGFELVAAIFKRAVRDTRAKCPRVRADAIEFLDVAAPDWREELRQRGRR